MTDSNAAGGDADLSDREHGETLHEFARQVLAEDDAAAGSELAARTRAERLAEAQLMALQALYLEMRHGHDQLGEQTEILSSYATSMDKLRGAMYDHGSAMRKLEGSLDDHAFALRRWQG